MDTTAEQGLQVALVEAASRYEGRLDGALVTVVDVRREGDLLVVTHTGTEPAFRGRGLAGETTAALFDDVRRRGLKVRPLCPFTADWARQHPEVADLLS